jgi:imidazolonepropionase-like amidohydrolase
MNRIARLSHCIIAIIALASAVAFAQTPKPQKPATTKPATTKPATPAPATTMAPAETIALKGGKLLTITHGVIENGVLVMSGGHITAVGGPSTAIPKGARVIDVTGMTVYPGFIDSETTLGLIEIAAVQQTNDTEEATDEIYPQLHVYDAFHAETTHIPITRVNGVTNAIVAPGERDTIPGQDSFIQLAGANANEMLMVRDIALPINFTGEQRRNQGGFNNLKYPSTRGGQAAQLRQALLDAQDYLQKWDDYNKKKAARPENSKDKEPEPPKRDLKLEALIPYLRGQKPVVVAANEGSDLIAILHLVEEFHLKVVLNHLAHSQDVLDIIAAAHVPVIVGSIYEIPKEHERYDAVFSLPALLNQRGVKIAFASYGDFSEEQPRDLPYAAGYAVAYGLPYDEALKALTINPAEIWGVADRLGSLDVNKDANVVVANGDPLEVKTDVKHVFIGGREISLENRQTRLRDMYWK